MKKLLFLMLPLMAIGSLYSNDEVYIEPTEESTFEAPSNAIPIEEDNRTLAARTTNKKENRTIRRDHNPTMNANRATTEQRQNYLKGPTQTYQANPGSGNYYYYNQPQPQTVINPNPNSNPLYPNQPR